MLSLIVILVLMFIVFSLTREKAKNWQGLVLVLFVLFVVELFSYLYLIFLISRGGNFFLIGNQALLDRLLKMHHVEAAFSDERSKYSTYRVDNDLGYTLGQSKYYARFPMSNSQGLRSLKEYALTPPDNTLRMAAFGDSFVFCDGELTQNTWTNILESSGQSLEVLNFGIGGYGLGQSYLRYLKDGLQFKPDIVFFNYVLLTDRDRFSAIDIIRGHSLREAHIYRVRFWLEDGILKTQNMTLMDLFDREFRRRYVYAPLGLKENPGIWSWPVFSVSNTGLLIKQAVLKKELVDHHKEPYALTAEDIEVNRKILQNLLEASRENGSTVLFFVKHDFEDLPEKIKEVLNQYRSMVVYVNGQKMLEEMFERRGLTRADIMNETGHYNLRGNQIYAQAVAEILVSHAWGTKERSFRFDPQQSIFIRK